METEKEEVARSLGQFYTKPDLAAKYCEVILNRWKSAGVLFVEPSAGTGAFVAPIKKANRKYRAIDIEPKSSLVEKVNFLESNEVEEGKHDAIVVIGNPPFGKNSSLAIKFFNRAACFADEIAFILPRTFRKTSVHAKLHPNFHLVMDEEVGKNAFIYEGKEHDVPCCWQIWKRKSSKRLSTHVPSVDQLIEYTTPEKADFAMRRVGFYAGSIKTHQIDSLSESTHYFIKEKTKGVMQVLTNIDWVSITSQTAGARSLSKTELATVLGDAYGIN